VCYCRPSLFLFFLPPVPLVLSPTEFFIPLFPLLRLFFSSPPLSSFPPLPLSLLLFLSQLRSDLLSPPLPALPIFFLSLCSLHCRSCHSSTFLLRCHASYLSPSPRGIASFLVTLLFVTFSSGVVSSSTSASVVFSSCLRCLQSCRWLHCHQCRYSSFLHLRSCCWLHWH
jgi:hypothetical protein